FMATADMKFGPITTIRERRKLLKKIPWSAFQLLAADWRWVELCANVLADANWFYQICSSTRVPTLHQVIPAIELLSSCWEKKAEDADYAIFHSALGRGLEKLTKYYKKFDNMHVYVLSLLLHPYYKLAYIEQMWGGEDEYQDDLAAGLPGARNWQAYANEIVEKAMQDYWPKCLVGQGTAVPVPSDADNIEDGEDDYDRTHAQRLRAAATKGWKVELD
ncbi:hypothetical protein C2E23DRAFT_702760, partial [Lenzites betulinus]